MTLLRVLESLAASKQKRIIEAAVEAAQVDVLLESHRALHETISRSDEDKIEAIVKRVLKGSDYEKIFLRMSKNVLTSLFKLLYTRRASWRDSLSATQSD